MSYLETRLSKLGITLELNQVRLWQYNAATQQNELLPVPIFREHPKGFEIIVYTIGREMVTYKPSDTSDKGSRYSRNWSIIRHENPPVDPLTGKARKYSMPKGNGSYPFFPPALVDKYDAKTPIHTLFLTEGFTKAFKASMHGLDIIGLPSITHLKEKATGALHSDILALIKTCQVQRIVWLVDGDCLDLSRKALEDTPEGRKVDLRIRPASFFGSVSTFVKELDSFKTVEKWFYYIATDIIYANATFFADMAARPPRDEFKGIDDILCSFPERTGEIVNQALNVNGNSDWFYRYNVTWPTGMSRVWDLFQLGDATKFYQWHCERQSGIREEFVYGGTQYRYNADKCQCDILVPGDAAKYFRVGNDFYKWVIKTDAYGHQTKGYAGRLKGTIVDDHGKDFVKHIPRYEEFINIPSHTAYQPVIDGCFNIYHALKVKPAEEDCTLDDCPNIAAYIGHIFGNTLAKYKHPKTKKEITVSHFDMAMDYLQLLYLHPTQKLPIVCLVSRERNTGKTTFAHLLKLMFEGNAAIVTNEDLSDKFNDHWAKKLLCIVDETYVEKQLIVERLKSLSTARKMNMNAKNKDQVEIDVFLHFVLMSNNEENFLPIDSEEIRFWVHKVPVLKEDKVNMVELMEEEIPAFLNYLARRELVTQRESRMWFADGLLKTDALARVQQKAKPAVVKELQEELRERFFASGAATIQMTAMDIQQEFFAKRSFEKYYIRDLVELHFKAETYHQYRYKGKLHKTIDAAISAVYKDMGAAVGSDLEAQGFITKEPSGCKYKYPTWGNAQSLKPGEQGEKTIVWRSCNTGRPYTFYRENFLTPEEIAGSLTDEVKATQGPDDGSDDLPF